MWQLWSAKPRWVILRGRSIDRWQTLGTWPWLQFWKGPHSRMSLVTALCGLLTKTCTQGPGSSHPCCLQETGSLTSVLAMKYQTTLYLAPSLLSCSPKLVFFRQECRSIHTHLSSLERLANLSLTADPDMALNCGPSPFSTADDSKTG